MKNPEYQLGMTYEEYSSWYAALGEDTGPFGPPDSPDVWNSADGMKECVRNLRAYRPANSIGHLALQMQIKRAEERLECLISKDSNP